MDSSRSEYEVMKVVAPMTFLVTPMSKSWIFNTRRWRRSEACKTREARWHCLLMDFKDSTSVFFFYFSDPNNHETEFVKMEDMDIDSIVDIPDTLDRLSSQQVNGGNFVDEESNLSIAGPTFRVLILQLKDLQQMNGGNFVDEEC